MYRIKIFFIAACSLCALINFTTHGMSLDPEKLVESAEGPLRKLVEKICRESLYPLLTEIKKDMQVLSQSTCRNLLSVGYGIAGLTILTTTILVPVIKQFKSDHKTAHSLWSIGTYTLGIGSGIGLLATAHMGLKDT